MQVHHSLSAFKATANSVVTVGTFDGVHVGHRKILSMLRATAAECKGEVVVLTFHPHPRLVLFPDQPGPKMLNTISEKTALLNEMGVDHLVIEPFTEEFSRMEYDDFVRDILVRQLNVHTLVIGYDHQFGRGRKGNINLLKELAEKLEFKVIEIPEQDIENAAVSSTRIRRAVEAGQVRDAAELLGYHYNLSGKVIHGKKLGRELGYPTANIQPDDASKLVPAIGIYAVEVTYKGTLFGGMLSIGTRPTFDDGEVSIEVNIFGLDQDLYGETLTIHFIERIRDELKFDSIDELVKRIAMDKTESLQILGRK